MDRLIAYRTKLEVTRGYLNQLSNTSGLSNKQELPLLRRSKRYKLRIPEGRVEVGLMYARSLLELLDKYNSTRKLDIIEQLQSRAILIAINSTTMKYNASCVITLEVFPRHRKVEIL